MARLKLGFNASRAWARYERPMRRVLEYVYDHLDEPLDLAALADVACLSPQHWHRLYHALAGETMAQTVRRLRMHRAAGQLAAGPAPLRRVAALAGYSSTQAFSRAFKAAYGLSPERYHVDGEHRRFEVGMTAPDVERPGPDGGPPFDVTELVLRPARGFGAHHRGAYLNIGKAFDQLIARVAALGLGRPGMRLLALFHDDPSRVEPADLRSTAVVLGCAEAPAGSGLLEVAVPGGPHARLAHTGPYASMPAAYQWLFGHWLVVNDLAPGSGPVIEEYLNSPRQTEPRHLRTYLQVPIAPIDPQAPAGALANA